MCLSYSIYNWEVPLRVVVSSRLLDFGNTVRLREIEESEGKTYQQAQCWMMIGKIAQQTT